MNAIATALILSVKPTRRSRIFLLGAAGEQEENGLGASASGPAAEPLAQNVPLGSRVVSQKVNFWGQGNKGSLISSAVRRRTGEYPPGRLLLPGGLCCRVTASCALPVALSPCSMPRAPGLAPTKEPLPSATTGQEPSRGIMSTRAMRVTACFAPPMAR